MIRLLAVAGLLACACAGRRGVPFGPPLALDAQESLGERVFMQHCNGCHPGGGGGLGPSIYDKPLPSVAMRTQVRQGLGAMPAFPVGLISDEELEAVVAFMNRLQEDD